MKIVQKLFQAILNRLEVWILALLGILGGGFLIFWQDLLNQELLKLIPHLRILQASEVLLILMLLLGAYIFHLHHKSKNEMSELKTFLNNYVYSKHEIHNPFFQEASHTIDDHLSLKPFYKAVEKRSQEKQTK